MARGGIKQSKRTLQDDKHTNWLEQGCIFPGIPTHNSKHAQFQQKNKNKKKQRNTPKKPQNQRRCSYASDTWCQFV